MSLKGLSISRVRLCSSCKTELPSTRKYAYCQPCANDYNRAFFANNPDKHEARKAQQREYAARGRKTPERKQYQKEYAQRQRERLREYKATLKCARCGFAHPRALDFHHRDPASKKYSIGRASAHLGWDTLLAEISKCDVLCSNCHRIEHDDD